MENTDILELNTYSINNIEYCTLPDVDKDVELFVEDKIIDKKIMSNKVDVLIRRQVAFEPKHMFSMSVETFISFDREKMEKRNLQKIKEQEIDEEIKENSNPVFNRISLIISVVTSQALGLPLITPPSFIDKKMLI